MHRLAASPAALPFASATPRSRSRSHASATRFSRLVPPPASILFIRNKFLRYGDTKGIRQLSTRAAGRAYGEAEVEFGAGGARLQLRVGAGLAAQADGAAAARLGDTCVLATLVATRTPPRFKPPEWRLTVDYLEKQGALARVPSNATKRETVQSEREVATAALLERCMRAVFPPGYTCETQLSCSLLAGDGTHDPDVLALNAAAAALAHAPLACPRPAFAAVRVARDATSGHLRACPSQAELRRADAALLLAATRDRLLLVDAGLLAPSRALSPDQLHDMLRVAHQHVRAILQAQDQALEAAGPRDAAPSEMLTRATAVAQPSTELMESARAVAGPGYVAALQLPRRQRVDELARLDALVANTLRIKWFRVQDAEIAQACRALVLEAYQARMSRQAERFDGRLAHQIRPLLLRMSELSGGVELVADDTHLVMHPARVSKNERPEPAFLLDGCIAPASGAKRLFCHVEEPAHAFTQVARRGRTADRSAEIVHSSRVERALAAHHGYPMLTRVTGELLSHDGSALAHAITACSAALLRAGENLLDAPVAAVSLAHMAHADALLLDPTELEEELADALLTVAGSPAALTGVSMEGRGGGLDLPQLRLALDSAAAALTRPHALLAEFAPASASTAALPIEPILKPMLSEVLQFSDEFQGRMVVGRGGAQLRRIEKEFDVRVVVTPASCTLEGTDAVRLKAARAFVERMLAAPVLHSRTRVRVEELRPFGVMVEVLGTGRRGIVRISDLPRPPPLVGAELDVVVVEIQPDHRLRFVPVPDTEPKRT